MTGKTLKQHHRRNIPIKVDKWSNIVIISQPSLDTGVLTRRIFESIFFEILAEEVR